MFLKLLQYLVLFCCYCLCDLYPFHDGGRYHIETSFYMITATVMKGLNIIQVDMRIEYDAKTL